MKSLLGWLALSLLFLIGGVMFAQRDRPRRVGDVHIDGQTIDATDPPLQRLDAICELAGHCDSMPPDGDASTLKVVSLEHDVLEMSIELERFQGSSTVYEVHQLSSLYIELRYLDLEALRADIQHPEPPTQDGCAYLKLSALKVNGDGLLTTKTRDLLSGEKTGRAAPTVFLCFSAQDACDGARQAILDLAEEAMQEPNPAPSFGRRGQD